MNVKKTTITFFSLLILDLIMYFYMFNSIGLHNFSLIIISNLKITFIISLLTNLFDFKTNKYIYNLLIIIITFIYLVNFFYFNFYGNILSFYSTMKGTQVLEFYMQIISVFVRKIVYILLFFIPILLLFTKINFNKNKFSIPINLFFIIILHLLFINLLNINKDELYSPYNLYNNKHHPIMNFKHFGLINTNYLDIYRYYNGFDEEINLTNDKVLKVNKKYHTLDIDLDKDYKNNNINKINKYIKNIEPTSHNEYTGLFEGKNLIYITAESFHPLAVDKDITPTLYRLVNSSFKFTNYYVPLYNVSTSDGEYLSLNSLLPKDNVWSMIESKDKYLPFSYGNIFKDEGYKTFAYHNGNYKYYERNETHVNLGYKFKACGNGLEKDINCKMWPQSDIEMINTTYKNFINEDKFVAYYMTISGHLEYNFFGNNIAYKNKDLVKNLKYSNKLKAYYATHIELDKALEILLDKLKKHDKLDDTVIVLTSDHYPYGLDIKTMNEKLNIKDNNFDIHKNSLVIYNNKFKDDINVDKLSSNIDILPTVLNLFNLKFDSRLLIGRDILSDSEPLVIFNDRSFISNYGKYDLPNNKFISNKKIKNSYIDNINLDISNKFNISKLILEEDYYNYVLGGKNDR